jgi:cytochrome P450
MFAYLIGAVVLFVIYKTLPPKRTAPGPTIYPIFGTPAASIHRFNKRHEIFPELSRKYGPIVQLVMPFSMRIWYLVSDPVLAREIMTAKDVFNGRSSDDPLLLVVPKGILALQDGDIWRSHRRVMTAPLFNREHLMSYMGTINFSLKALVASMEKAASSSSSVNVAELFRRMTLDAIMRLAFGYKGGDDGVTKMATGVDILAMGAVVHRNLPTFIWNMMPLKKSFEKMLKFSHHLVEMATESGEAPKGSIIEALRNAEDPETKQKLPADELRDEALDILLAGHETLTNTLGWATYLLTKPENRRALEKLVEEIDTVLGKREEISFDDVEKMTYAQSVIMEALRMIPTVPFFVRFCEKGTTLSDKTQILPNSSIFISNMNTLEEKYFENPWSFMPERHLDSLNQDKKRDFFPFGGGHRMCIGKRLAQVESVMILAKFLQNFSIERVPGFEPQKLFAVTLSSSNGIRVKLSRRA